MLCVYYSTLLLHRANTIWITKDYMLFKYTIRIMITFIVKKADTLYYILYLLYP